MSEKVTFDTAVAMAFQQLKQQNLSAFPDLNSLSANFRPTEIHTNKINTAITQAERKQKQSVMFRHLATTAAAVILAVMVLFSNTTVATAMKKIFSQTVVQWFDKYVSVETHADAYPQQIKDFTVGYMTDGFVLVEEYKIGTMIQKVYYKDELYLSIQIDNDDNSNIIGLDNEYTSKENIMIGGNKAILVTRKDGYTALITSSNGLQFFIDGYVQSDEIIKIFENIEISL